MRVNRSAHVEAKSEGEFAKLDDMNLDTSEAIFTQRTYFCIVALPSLENILPSELVVWLLPITRGFGVVPSK
jgi:hypothetical protein